MIPKPLHRIECFEKLGYGMFIHWGLYAQAGGVWKGQKYFGIGEWLMNRAKIPTKEYETLAAQFNPRATSLQYATPSLVLEMRTGSIDAFQATPATPLALLVAAAAVPATAVPWPLISAMLLLPSTAL